MNAKSAPQETTPADQTAQTDLPVGEVLRRERVRYNLSLQDVSTHLRIRASQLEALEQGNTEQLPGRVYAIGYVRTYAEYLGLDGEKMIELFKQQASGRAAQKPEYHFPVAASESKGPNVAMIFGSLIVLAIVLGLWIVMGASNAPSSARLADANAIPAVPSEIQIEQGLNQAMQAQVPKMTTSVQTPDVTVPPATPATPAQPDPAADMAAVTGDGVASETPLPTIEVEPDADLVATPATEQTSETAATIPPPPPAPAAPKKEIIINVKDRSWVEVRDKRGKTILSRILRPGEVFIVPEENYGLRLDTGNAGGLELVVNGQKIPALGRQGDILRGFILDGESILNNGALATRGLNQ